MEHPLVHCYIEATILLADDMLYLFPGGGCVEGGRSLQQTKHKQPPPPASVRTANNVQKISQLL